MRGANMGGEDFAVYLDELPGCYVRFGTRPPEGDVHPAHSSLFRVDEDVLGTGAMWFAAVARAAGRVLARPEATAGRGNLVGEMP
jgi:hippurate hydrolase